MRRSLIFGACASLLLAASPAHAAVDPRLPKPKAGYRWEQECRVLKRAIRNIYFRRNYTRCRWVEVKIPKEELAVAWAKKQVGKTKQPNGLPWALWCDRFVGSAYGRVPSGYMSAKTHYLNLKKRGMIKTKGTPPVGALVFYEGYKGLGHVALSLGGGRVVTSPSKAGQAVFIAPINTYSHYLGWSKPDPEWLK